VLEISEIFGPTIQGEGKRAGKVSVFIRVAGCNMSCAGFGVEYKVDGKLKQGCDSFYAVDKGFKNSWGRLSSTDIIYKIKQLTTLDKVDIVITGGEPLLYWENQDFQDLLKYFIKNKHFVTIETNGSINIDINKKYQKEVMFSIGLKLSNSGEKLERRVNLKALRDIFKNSKSSYLKFVISGTKKEMEEIVKIKEQLNLSKNKIYLMPLSGTDRNIQKNAKRVVENAIKYHFNYSDRLHIRIWNDKRKV
jgi:organic radical activating enzyme